MNKKVQIREQQRFYFQINVCNHWNLDHVRNISNDTISMSLHVNVLGFNMVDVEVCYRISLFGQCHCIGFFLGNDNNFMTHDECEAMCEDLIQDQKPSMFHSFCYFKISRFFPSGA